mgnify:FL=1
MKSMQTPQSPAAGEIAAPSGSGLFGVYYSGSDEYHAAISEDSANKAAAEFNEWFKNQPKTENTPSMKATAVPWPFNATSHAASLSA